MPLLKLFSDQLEFLVQNASKDRASSISDVKVADGQKAFLSNRDFVNDILDDDVAWTSKREGLIALIQGNRINLASLDPLQGAPEVIMLAPALLACILLRFSTFLMTSSLRNTLILWRPKLARLSTCSSRTWLRCTTLSSGRFQARIDSSWWCTASTSRLTARTRTSLLKAVRTEWRAFRIKRSHF